MDDLIQRYYEAEMRYLKEAGKEFAKKHPERAGLLNLDQVGERDPFVERLFEGFAFLMGRLRQKLDDDLPELTEGLVSLLWPHYLRMIPSLSIVELQPTLDTLSRKESIESGFVVSTSPMGSAKTRCHYRTTQPVELQPIEITSAGSRILNQGRTSIFITFSLGDLAELQRIDLSTLRLFLNADTPVAFELYYNLTRKVSKIQLSYPDAPSELPTILKQASIEAVGFNDDQRLWLKPDNAFGGYQLLLEYFSFREKFLFVDLKGIALQKNKKQFTVEIILEESLSSDLTFNEENIRLHCTPAINLFPIEADPIFINQIENEYLLRPLLQQDGHIEIYSVDAVQSISRKGRFNYLPFTSFRHRGGMLRHDSPERYYHSRIRKGVTGLNDTWLILGGQIWESESRLEEEVLSVTITGTNGMLPHKVLRNATINHCKDYNLHIRSVKNLSALTLPCYPPVEDRFHWRVLSHLVPNYLSLMNAEVLRGTLALYDWTHGELNRRRLEGILEVSHRVIKRVREGSLEKGVEIEITLNEEQFSGRGDVVLFGEILHHFFALYADLNLFTRLAIHLLPSGEHIVWKESKTSREAI